MAQSTATNIKRKIQTLKDELDFKDKEIEDLKGKLKAADDRADAIENLYQEKARECDRLHQDIDKLQDTLSTKEAELQEMTKEMESALEHLSGI